MKKNKQWIQQSLLTKKKKPLIKKKKQKVPLKNHFCKSCKRKITNIVSVKRKYGKICFMKLPKTGKLEDY